MIDYVACVVRERKNTVRVLLNGGPTRAFLDEVRFLSNISSGQLAFEIARALIGKKIEVAAVMGPTALDFSQLRLSKLANVETIEEMRERMLALCKTFKPDFIVFSAAVLDFVPEKKQFGKVSSKGGWTLRLKPSPKIVDEVARRYPSAKRIGFKLEWKKRSLASAKRYGAKLLKEKNLHALCLNYLSEIREGGHPALLFTRDEAPVVAKSKKEIARWIASVCRV